jgi:hypothetical protein
MKLADFYKKKIRINKNLVEGFLFWQNNLRISDIFGKI